MLMRVRGVLDVLDLVCHNRFDSLPSRQGRLVKTCLLEAHNRRQFHRWWRVRAPQWKTQKHVFTCFYNDEVLTKVVKVILQVAFCDVTSTRLTRFTRHFFWWTWLWSIFELSWYVVVRPATPSLPVRSCRHGRHSIHIYSPSKMDD